jgi:hypothetical protein
MFDMRFTAHDFLLPDPRPLVSVSLLALRLCAFAPFSIHYLIPFKKFLSSRFPTEVIIDSG